MADQASGMGDRASGRALGEIGRFRDVRLGTGQSILAGLLIGILAIAIKGALNEAVGGSTGYIILMAAAVLAAWFGGLAGGITTVSTAVVLNTVVFLNEPGGATTTSQFLQVLYLVTSAATVLLVASRRAARDGLVDALAEVSALAEQIESRDARLELMLAASGTGFWEWDVESGELTWSEAIFHLHGMKPEAHAPAYGAYLDMIHPDDRAAFESAVAAAVEGAGFALDFRIVLADGSVRWTHGAGRMFRSEDGRPLRMIGTGQDITDQRRLSDDRDRLIADERRAGEFRDAFVDVISHELRTPITTILGLTQILARPGRTDDEASRQALLEDVRSESERLHRLVEDLLVLSRVERGLLAVEAEPLEVRRLLERIVAHESLELPSIAVETDLDPDLPIVAGESTYVEQIVRNLLNNAAKYSPSGSTVVVSAKKVGATVEIRVKDDGPGIPPASIERIFELFYRDPESSRSVAGSGIGLFVCASLVEAMGGRIWAARPAAGGTEIGFSLRTLEPDDWEGETTSKWRRDSLKSPAGDRIDEASRPAG